MLSSETCSAFRRCIRGESRALRGRRLHVRPLARTVATLVLLAATLTPSLAATRPALAIASASDAEPTYTRLNAHYIQYGVGLGPDTILEAGKICPSGAVAPCILGSGAGMTIRVGYRGRGPWYFGGAYSFSRHDASNLVRLPIVQQLRGEARLYGSREHRVNPFLSLTAGGTVYGNEWAIDTGGPAFSLGVGIEVEVTPDTVLLTSLSYRTLSLRRWRDETGTLRADGVLGFGTAHALSIEFSFELRSQLSRW